jgi:hypothetical protein
MITIPSSVPATCSTLMQTSSMRRSPPKNPICKSALLRAAFRMPRLASCATMRSRSSIGSALAFFFGAAVRAIPARVFLTEGVDAGSGTAWWASSPK